MATGLIALGALFLSSCIQFEEKVILNPDNTGKTRVTLVMPNPMEMMGAAVGELGGPDAAAEMPSAEDMAKEMAQGILGEASGVDAWRDVSWGVTPDGKMRFQGVAYFRDFNEFSAQGGGEGGMDMDIGTPKSSMRDGKWVIAIEMEEDAGDPAAAGPQIPADQIDAVIAQSRQQWEGQKQMMGMMLGGMRMEYRLKVAGTVDSVSGFTKHEENVAGIVMEGSKMIAAMEGLIADDEAMRKMMTEGSFDESGMPQPPDDQMMELLFGAPGPLEMVITPGAPLFDYDAEVAAAQAAMSDELKQMIEAGKAAAAEGGDDFGDFGADPPNDDPF